VRSRWTSDLANESIVSVHLRHRRGLNALGPTIAIVDLAIVADREF
jgi:hypothetical protein